MLSQKDPRRTMATQRYSPPNWPKLDPPHTAMTKEEERRRKTGFYAPLISPSLSAHNNAVPLDYFVF